MSLMIKGDERCATTSQHWMRQTETERERMKDREREREWERDGEKMLYDLLLTIYTYLTV